MPCRYGKSNASANCAACYYVKTHYVYLTAASSTFSPSPYLDVCPGGVAEFTCTVEDKDTPVATFWRINETAVECVVFHSGAPVNCGPYHLTLNLPMGNR